MSANAAMEVCLLSGANLATLAPDEFKRKTAKALKQALSAQIGVSRFQQRLFSEDGSALPLRGSFRWWYWIFIQLMPNKTNK